MSLLRTIKKNIARNRAKELNRPKESAFKLETLEPRLLLTGSPVDSAQSKVIMDTLSHYSVPVLPGMTLSDIVHAEAHVKGVADDALLAAIATIDNATRMVDVDVSKFTNDINIFNDFGPFHSDVTTSTLKVGQSGTSSKIDFNYDTGASLTASLELKNPQITGKIDFGFLEVKYQSSDVDIIGSFNSDGTFTIADQKSPSTISLKATLPGSSTENTYTVSYDSATGKFSSTSLDGFKNIAAGSVGGQLKNFTSWLDSLDKSALFVDPKLDTGMLSADAVSKALDMGTVLKNKLTTGANPVFQDADLSKTNFTDIQDLANKLGATVSLTDNRLSYTFNLDLSFNKSIPADFHVDYGKLGSITSYSEFGLSSTAGLAVTIGFDLSNDSGTLSQTSSISSLTTPVSYTKIADSALSPNSLLCSDAGFIIGIGTEQYLVTVPQAASRSFASSGDLVTYLNGATTGFAVAIKKSTGTVTPLTGFSASLSSGKLVISASSDFTLNTPQWADPLTYASGGNDLIGLSGKVDSTTSLNQVALAITPSFSSGTKHLSGDSQFTLSLGGDSVFTVTVTQASTKDNSSVADLLIRS